MNRNTVNKVILVGYISKEPRLHQENDGEKTLCFNVVTTEIIKHQVQEQVHEETHTIRISEHLLGGVKLEKGMNVFVQGKLQTKAFVDEANIRRYKTTIFAFSAEPASIAEINRSNLSLSHT